MTPDDYFALLARHRSIRRYRSDPVDEALIDRVLVAALQGGSSSGNLNLVSVIKTSDPARRQRLYELQREQPMVLQAPWVLTFCADAHRTRRWLGLRGARLGFDDLLSYTTAAFDAMILAQTAALGFEAHGLGLCYMGTTMWAQDGLAEALELPPHVLPVTSYVLGWPDEAPPQRDRLPALAWLHREVYHTPTAADIDRDFAEREQRGWQRYRDMGPDVVAQMAALGVTSLAQFYTSKMKYDPDLFAELSRELASALERHGFGVPPAAGDAP